MNFDQSGLPPIQLIQDAFNHSFAYLMATEAEEMRNFEKQVARAIRQNLTMVEQEKRAGRITEEQYQQALKDLERARVHNMQEGPKMIRRELEKAFIKSHLKPAQELFASAETATPEALAAIMLVECVRSPRDFRKLQDTFGPVVADLVGDLIHAEAYAQTRADTLSAASDDVKRAYTALAIATLDGISAQVDAVKKRNPAGEMNFPDGYEKKVFDSGNATWRADAKLDARLISAFNHAAEKVSSKFRLDRSSEGDLILVPFKPPVPPNKPPNTPNLPAVRPPALNNNGAIGKEAF